MLVEVTIVQNIVYLLQHEFELQGHDEATLLGVFTERRLAEEAQEFYATQKGFRDHLDGFSIDEIQLNRRLWSEGFVID